MKHVFVMFICLLLPCLSAVGQQTIYLSADTIIEKDSLHNNTFISYQFRIPEIEGVGSTYERAQKNALSKIRKVLCLADYEDVPKISLWCTAMWTKGKNVHVVLTVMMNEFFDYEKHLSNQQNIKRKKLTARKMTKSEKKSIDEGLKIRFNENEFRKYMQEKFKEYKESK